MIDIEEIRKKKCCISNHERILMILYDNRERWLTAGEIAKQSNGRLSSLSVSSYMRRVIDRFGCINKKYDKNIYREIYHYEETE